MYDRFYAISPGSLSTIIFCGKS